MNTLRCLALVLPMLLLWPLPASGWELKQAFQMGGEGGGDKLITILDREGETKEIRGGDGFFFGIGVTLIPEQPAYRKWRTQFTVNWKFEYDETRRGKLNWERFPLEIMQFYVARPWRYGIGLSYQPGPRLDGKGELAAIDTKYEASLGYMFQVIHVTDDHHFVGARFILIEYEERGSDTTLSGNSYGIVVGVQF